MTKRVLLNSLAVILLLIGAGMALSNLAMLLLAASQAVSTHARISSDFPLFVIMALGTALFALGFYIAHRAWEHLQRPNATTARDVISFGIYLVFFSCATPLLRHHPYLALLTVIMLAVLRHYTVKRLATQFGGVH